MEKFSSGCTLDCFDCCKFNVYKDEQGNIRLEGDKNHPFTKGFICKKGRAHKEYLNHPKRILKPLLKIDGKWNEISFNKAMDIFIDGLKKYENKNILYYEQYGNGGLLKSIGDIFFNFYGGCLKQKGGPCWSAGMKAQKLDFGNALSNSLEDLKNSKNIFVWGKNPKVTTIHTMKALLDAKKAGAKLIVIDPIYTETAKESDIYIKIKPGGDYYLALAMGKLIIENGLINKEFLRKHTLNFEEYKKFLEETSMEILLDRSGLGLKEIEDLVNLYTEKNSSIWIGYGIQKYKNGGKTIRAIDVLGAITGQIGVAGGGVNYANKFYPKILNTDPYESSKYGENKELIFNEMLENISNGQVKMAVITKSNMLNQLPNLNKLEAAFRKIEFKVCFDQFLTDTAKECDLFIPTTMTLESEDLLFSSMTNPYIIYKECIVKPKEKFMDEYEFFKEVARKINLKDYPFVTKSEYLEKVLKPIDVTLDEVKNGYINIQNNVAWEDLKFSTKSKKFEIGKFSIEKDSYKENKLRLITTHTKDSLFSQHFIDVDHRSIAYINKSLGEKLKIKENDIVELKSDNGRMVVRILFNNGISEEVIMMHVGWWKKSGNPNKLTTSTLSDIGGQIAYNETFVEINLI